MDEKQRQDQQQQQQQGDRRRSQSQYQGEDRRKAQNDVEAPGDQAADPGMSTQARKDEQEEKMQQQHKDHGST